MNILVLGGTGAMGIHLVEIIAQDTNNKIFVTSRKEHKSSKTNIEYVLGNAHNFDFLKTLLLKENWDVIVDFMVYSTKEFEINSKFLLSSCSQYIFLSSARVYADSKIPITEKSPRLLDVCNDKDFLFTDEYPLTKARQENILFYSNLKNWTIIRPYITYSENRLQLGVLEKELWLYIAMNGHKLIFSNDIAPHKTTLTYGYDVARGIAALIGKKEALGEAFHITGNNVIEWKEVFNIYSNTLREQKIKIQEVMKEKNYRLYTNDYAKYQLLYDRYYDRVFDNSKISRFIDIQSFKKPEIGLRECLIEFLKKPDFGDVDLNGVYQIIKGTGCFLPIWKIKGVKHKVQYILIKLHLL